VILDSSVLVAIALDEPDREAIIARINTTETLAVGAPTLAEAGIVISARAGTDATELLGQLVATADVTVIDFTDLHWREAVSAWLRFGKSRHPAALNFGDCLSYATARVAGQPLLAKGEDFSKTDIRLA
jgi:ribonuclease VapC